MRKMFKIFLIFFLTISFLSVNASFAEEVNPVKKKWRSFLNKVKSLKPKPVAKEPRPPKAGRAKKIREASPPARKPKKPLPRAAKGRKARPARDKKPITTIVADMTKDELINRIKGVLEGNPEIADFIPQLKITRDSRGGIVKVEYNTGTAFENLEGLDKKTLEGIFVRVNNERVRLNYERIQRQLEAARRAREMRRVAAPPPAPPKAPPMPPKVPSVPRTPSSRR